MSNGQSTDGIFIQSIRPSTYNYPLIIRAPLKLRLSPRIYKWRFLDENISMQKKTLVCGS